MNTRDRIIKAIKHFNAMYDNQVNLSSEAAIEGLAELVHNAVLKQMHFDNTGTYNDQQLELFSNNDPLEHK